MGIGARSWWVRLQCGQTVSGREVGAFRLVRDRGDLVDCWVATRQGRIPAPRIPGRRVLGFDFRQAKEGWELVTRYAECLLVKTIFADGRQEIAKRREGLWPGA